MDGSGSDGAIPDHADAAGRAAGAAAADARMRDLMAQARLQHAEALRHPDRAAIAVGQGDHAAAALVQRAHAPCRQHKSDQAEIEDQEIFHDLSRMSCSAGVPTLSARKIGGSPFGAGAVARDASPALVETEHGQRRHQHRRGKQKGRGGFEERLHPQPEIKPDAAVDPGDDQHRQHQPHSVEAIPPSSRKAPADRAFPCPNSVWPSRTPAMWATTSAGTLSPARAAAARSPSSEIAGARKAPRSRDRREPARRCKT